MKGRKRWGSQQCDDSAPVLDPGWQRMRLNTLTTYSAHKVATRLQGAAVVLCRLVRSTACCCCVLL